MEGEVKEEGQNNGVAEGVGRVKNKNESPTVNYTANNKHGPASFTLSLSLSLLSVCVCVCVGVCYILGVIDVLLGFPLHFLFSSACCGSFGGALDINYRRRRRRRRCRKSTIGPNEGLPMASFFCFYPAFISI